MQIDKKKPCDFLKSTMPNWSICSLTKSWFWRSFSCWTLLSGGGCHSRVIWSNKGRSKSKLLLIILLWSSWASHFVCLYVGFPIELWLAHHALNGKTRFKFVRRAIYVGNYDSTYQATLIIHSLIHATHAMWVASIRNTCWNFGPGWCKNWVASMRIACQRVCNIEFIHLCTK